MSHYIKHVEDKRVFFLIPLEKKFDDRTAYLDLTDRAWDAIRKDRKMNYKSEDGPNFGHEVLNAMQYAQYVSDHAASHDLHKFNTRNYFFTVNALTDEQLGGEQKKA
jgi:hypothetical protein